MHEPVVRDRLPPTGESRVFPFSLGASEHPAGWTIAGLAHGWSRQLWRRLINYRQALRPQRDAKEEHDPAPPAVC